MISVWKEYGKSMKTVWGQYQACMGNVWEMHSWGIPAVGLTYQGSIKRAWNKYQTGMMEKYLASLPDRLLRQFGFLAFWLMYAGFTFFALVTILILFSKGKMAQSGNRCLTSVWGYGGFSVAHALVRTRGMPEIINKAKKKKSGSKMK